MDTDGAVSATRQCALRNAAAHDGSPGALGRLPGRLEASGFSAEAFILAGGLVAVAGCLTETIKVAFLSLSFAVERRQSLLKASCAKPVRVAVSFRFPRSPSFTASYALVHHSPPLGLIVLS
ncbi:hypothetical protein SBDP1_1040036 [Syntrophobacter sp. SbD1]|nr:hypothetical protein SBDP1_1040036 [Syntrophobacter sp. SbD1]